MSRWADWFMIPVEQADHFADVALVEGDKAVSELLAPLLEIQKSDAEMDKAWEPIHRCLTGDQTPYPAVNFDAGEYPLKLCVLGGEPRSLALVHGFEVPDVAEALSKIDMSWMSERFFALPDSQFHEIDDLTFDWVWLAFRHLPPLFARAVKQEFAVMCTISHRTSATCSALRLNGVLRSVPRILELTTHQAGERCGMFRQFGEKSRFAIEIGEFWDNTDAIRVVNVWAAGRWLTCDDNHAYVPHFVGMLQRAVNVFSITRSSLDQGDHTRSCHRPRITASYVSMPRLITASLERTDSWIGDRRLTT